jgi:predicted AlkP superfamily phosphohydrolase/phosphomutase
MAWDAAAMRLKRANPIWLPLEPFWRAMGQPGFRAVTIDVPMTHVPNTGQGLEIAGWGTHQVLTRCSVYPLSVKRDLARRFGELPLGSDIPSSKAIDERERVKRRLVRSAERKAQLVKWLNATQSWNFLLIVFGEVHRGGHVLWPADTSIDPNWLLEVYRAVDQAVGEIVADLRLQDTTVGIFALHGMGPNHSQEHFTSKILAAINCTHGTRTRDSRSAAPPNGRSALQVLGDRVPQKLQALAKRSLPRSVKDRLINKYHFNGQDWIRTPAFTLKSELNGYIRLNLRGREREGILDPDDPATHSYVQRLCEGFTSFQHESGAPLVSQIFVTSDIASGDKDRYLPDLAVCWTENQRPASSITSPLYGRIIARPDDWRLGHHRGHGFLAVMQPTAHDVAEFPSQLQVSELPAMIRGWLSAS